MKESLLRIIDLCIQKTQLFKLYVIQEKTSKPYAHRQHMKSYGLLVE